MSIFKDNIRIVAKGPGVIFHGRSVLTTAFVLSDVSGVMIEGIKLRHYRASSILIQAGLGNRIINNIGEYGIFLNNESSYNADTGMTLGSAAVGNLVKDNELVCNIPENIEYRGINNIFINNIDKPCKPCEASNI